MPSYTECKAEAENVAEVVLKDFMKPMAFEAFRQDNGVRVQEVLPGNNTEYTFELGPLSGYVNTDSRTVEYPMFDDTSITSNRIASEPWEFEGLAESLPEMWIDTFGEPTSASTGPDEPPMDTGSLREMLSDLTDMVRIVQADPTLIDMLAAIHDENYRAAIHFFNERDPNQVLDQTAGHELTNLFLQGEIHTVYRDSEIALLKPEYDHELQARVRAEQLSSRMVGRVNVTITGEVPEEAFVVGVDDTPQGLFAHAVDGTRLDPTQDVTREYINEVLEIDRSYTGEDVLRPNKGERIRLQGDFAVEYEGALDDPVDGDLCPIPVDNHYASLSNATLAPGETKDVEPITVHVGNDCALNVAHDEHNNVAATLEPGVYRFYLLHRGLKPQSSRPDWPEA